MGLYNVLCTDIVCPNCGRNNQARIQFKFGCTWLLEYKIGDTITWGGVEVGNPSLGKVKVYGIIENATCAFCLISSMPEDYDIYISYNLIEGLAPREGELDYLEGSGEYVILNE